MYLESDHFHLWSQPPAGLLRIIEVASYLLIPLPSLPLFHRFSTWAKSCHLCAQNPLVAPSIMKSPTLSGHFFVIPFTQPCFRHTDLLTFPQISTTYSCSRAFVFSAWIALPSDNLSNLPSPNIFFSVLHSPHWQTDKLEITVWPNSYMYIGENGLMSVKSHYCILFYNSLFNIKISPWNATYHFTWSSSFLTSFILTATLYSTV